MRIFLFVAAASILSLPCRADSAADVLRAFGWGGSFATDCSRAPSAKLNNKPDPTAVRARHVIPMSGAAPFVITSTNGIDYVHEVTSAVMSDPDTLEVTLKSETDQSAIETKGVVVKTRDGKYVSTQVTQTIVAKKAMSFDVAGTKKFYQPGESFAVQSIVNGISIDAGGLKLSQALAQERCDE